MTEKTTVGIKETLELMDGLKMITASLGAVMEDKKINMKDFPVLIGMLTQFQTLVEAYKGADEVWKELKDLDETESAQLIAKVYEIIAVSRQ